MPGSSGPHGRRDRGQYRAPAAMAMSAASHVVRSHDPPTLRGHDTKATTSNTSAVKDTAAHCLAEDVTLDSAVRAPGPAAWPAHAALHLVDADHDAALPGGFLLGRGDPADPLVPRERGDVQPKVLDHRVRLD